MTQYNLVGFWGRIMIRENGLEIIVREPPKTNVPKEQIGYSFEEHEEPKFTFLDKLVFKLMNGLDMDYVPENVENNIEFLAKEKGAKWIYVIPKLEKNSATFMLYFYKRNPEKFKRTSWAYESDFGLNPHKNQEIIDVDP
jgi:hypothetical protein